MFKKINPQFLNWAFLGLVLLSLILCISLAGCNPPTSMPPIHQTIRYIPLYPYGIEDFVHSDGQYIIKYCSEDFLDSNYLLEQDSVYSMPESISIVCSKDDFFDYISMYSRISKCSFNCEDVLDSHGYCIAEVSTKKDGVLNYQYRLIKGK